MEGKGSTFILLIIVALLSVTIAALAIGYFFIGGNKSSGTASETSTAVSTKVYVPDSKLAAEPFILFESAENFNLKKSNNPNVKSLDVILVSAEIKYYKTVPGLKDPLTKIKFYKEDIVKLIGDYFLNLTIDDVKNPEIHKKMEEDLKVEINKILLESEDHKKVTDDIVYTITLGKWFSQ